MPYKPESKILIITLDSFFKETGGRAEYDPRLSICQDLPNIKMRIMEVRQKIWSLLNKDQIHWPNDEDELVINKTLLKAEDFDGEANSALFLPAIDRYTGDFYQALGEKGKKALLLSKHHFLIISACYGILKPTELIQNYACQFGTPPNQAFNRWAKDKKNLTAILIEYLKKYDIIRIFDFTQCAVPAYQKAIVWDLIYHEFPQISVYHAHSWIPGDRPLRIFAEFVSNKMLTASEEDLLKIKLDYDMGQFRFQKKLPDLDKQTDSVANPLELIFEMDESDVVELKTCAFGGITSEQISINIANRIKTFSHIEDCQKIAKTLCSFMNSEGGDLFIGVKERTSIEEKNQVTGIESEMGKVKASGYQKTKEAYARLIQDGIIDVFIPEYIPATNCIKIDFHEYEGHIICWIKVKPSKKPVFMINYNRDNSNENSYKHLFCIRDGRESKPLDIKKASKYILIHFCPNQ